MNGAEEKQLFQTLGEIKATTEGNSAKLTQIEKNQGKLFEKAGENAKEIAVLDQQIKDCDEKVKTSLALQNRKHGMAATPGAGSLLWQIAEFFRGIFS